MLSMQTYVYHLLEARYLIVHSVVTMETLKLDTVNYLEMNSRWVM